jgi:tetratricopeptide (TPR) repeat protein
MKCPNCGAQSDGAFCSQCGAPLKGAKCHECQASLAAGARFCNNCGAPSGRSSKRAPAGGDSKLPWIFAGVALLILIVVLALPALRGNDGNESDGRVPLSQLDGSTEGGQGGAPGALAGTPREQADRLFNRVMTEREGGDTTQAKFFAPMAVQAYQLAGSLDADGYYHLSLLHNLLGDYRAALENAEKILATTPNHILGLSAAANAARGSGDQAKARQYFQRLVTNFDNESKATRQEYQDHANMLPEIRKEAEAFLK